MFFVPAAFNIIAREVILLLLERGQRVRAMLLSQHEEDDVRTFLRVHGFDGSQVEFVHGHLRDLDRFEAALEGITRVFLSSDAFPGYEPVLSDAIDRIATADVEQVVFVSVDQAGPDAPYALGRAMGRLERRLLDTGVPTTILRPLPFLLMQNARAQAAQIQQFGVFSMPTGDQRLAMIDCRDIAVAGVQTFADSAHIGQTYRLTGPEPVSGWDIAGEFTYQLGYPVRFQPVSTDHARQQMLGMQMPVDHVDDFVGLFEGEERPWLSEVGPDFERLMGRPPRSFSDFVGEYRWAFARAEEAGQLTGWLNYAP